VSSLSLITSSTQPRYMSTAEPSCAKTRLRPSPLCCLLIQSAGCYGSVIGSSSVSQRLSLIPMNRSSISLPSYIPEYGFPINQDVLKHILPNVEEVEDRALCYLIRMKSTGSHTYRKIGRMSYVASTADSELHFVVESRLQVPGKCPYLNTSLLRRLGNSCITPIIG
jgi:hypothetical protein